MALSISRHKAICKNVFEENRMAVFLWRIEHGTKRLNSYKESHGL